MCIEEIGGHNAHYLHKKICMHFLVFLFFGGINFVIGDCEFAHFDYYQG